MADPEYCGTTFPFSIITGRTIAGILEEDLDGCINIVRDAYLAHYHGRSVNPPAVFLCFGDKPNARIIGLPAYLDEPWRISGIKWIASYPDNVRQGVPRASAVLILNNHDCGYPFACLESSIISAARTAASAVLAASCLAAVERNTHTLGIIGTGFIARYVYRFLMGTGWKIDNIRLFDVIQSQAESFRDSVCDRWRHCSVRVAPDIDSAIRASDLILFSTVASEPYVHDVKLFEHRPTVLHISLRDLAPEIILESCNIVDDVDHVLCANTSPHLAEKVTGHRNFIRGTLAEVIEARCEPDQSKPVIFSPFGLGVLDLAVGKWIYDQAIARSEHILVDEFFYDMHR